jgi:sugar/nucleoside kinase (ribokinase family)
LRRVPDHYTAAHDRVISCSAVLDVITIGESFDDFIFHSLVGFPAAGEELKTSAFFRGPGGGAIITAIAAARMSLKCGVASGLSDEAVRLLQQEKIAVRNLRRDDEPMALTVSLSTRRDRRFVTYVGINDSLPDRFRSLLPSLRARHLHFAFDPGRCRGWARRIHALRRTGVTTSWDFGWNVHLVRDPDFFDLAAAVDYLFLNRAEAMLYSRRRTWHAAVERWRIAPRPVIIKLGPSGSRIVGGGVEFFASPASVRVVDTTGAGDAFNGGFLAARLRGCNLQAALRLGNLVGALSTRRPGGIAALPRARDL